MKGLAKFYSVGMGATALFCMLGIGYAYGEKERNKSAETLIRDLKEHPLELALTLTSVVAGWQLFWGHVLTMPRKKHTR